MTFARWPQQLDPCVIDRAGRTSLTPNGWINWQPDPSREPRPLPVEWIFRELLDADLADTLWVLTTLDQTGMVWNQWDSFRDDATTPAELPPPKRPPNDSVSATVHLSDVTGYLGGLRRLAMTWLAHKGEQRVDWEWFVLALARGLRIFTPRVAFGEPLGLMVVDLFEGGCHQLFNTIAEDLPVRRCRSETCGRMFFRKQGSSKYQAQTRGEVKYCSQQCRWAQGQRDYRRAAAT